MRIVNTKEMKEIEKTAETEYGLSESLVIENFGIRGSNHLHKEYLSNQDFTEVILFVGKGNNGADGLSIGRHLKEFGYSVRAFMLFDKDDCTEELLRQAKLAYAMGVKISEVKSSDEIYAYYSEAGQKFFTIDCIFGTGVRLPLSNFISEIIHHINNFSDITISVDIPSGVVGNNGETDGYAVQADTTLAVGVPKIGYYSTSGAKHVGHVEVIKAGFPKDLIKTGSKNLISIKLISRILGKRNMFAHKNSFGHTLVVGGNLGQTGAVVLAANGALKTGAGLVTAATWEDSYNELIPRLNPEVMSRFIPRDYSLMMNLVKQTHLFDTIVIGPGLGRGESARTLVLEVLKQYRGPVVLDADGINALNFDEDKEIIKSRTFPTIMTPHLGEFSALMKTSVQDIEASPVDYVRQAVDALNCYVLLKGPGTYLCFPTGEIYINFLPNAGMATGGSGDVLSGILGGLFAQAETDNQNFNTNYLNNKWDSSSVLGLFIHSLAGFLSAQETGPRAMTSWSIINNIHSAFSEIHDFQKGHK